MERIPRGGNSWDQLFHSLFGQIADALSFSFQIPPPPSIDWIQNSARVLLPGRPICYPRRLASLLDPTTKGWWSRAGVLKVENEQPCA